MGHRCFFFSRRLPPGEGAEAGDEEQYQGKQDDPVDIAHGQGEEPQPRGSPGQQRQHPQDKEDDHRAPFRVRELFRRRQGFHGFLGFFIGCLGRVPVMGCLLQANGGGRAPFRC